MKQRRTVVPASRLRFGLAGLLVSGLFGGCGVEPTVVRNSLEGDVALAKGGGGGGGGGTTVTATIAAATSLAPTPDNQFTVTIPSGGFLDIRPQCSSTDRLDLQGMGASFDALGSRSTCNGKSGAGFMFLKLFANTASVVGACGDLDAPDGTNFSASSRYFFQTDGPDADTKFDDAQYTLVLKDCWVHGVAGEPNARRITAGVGDLYAGQTGTPLAGFTNIAVSVDVTIRP